MIRGYFVIEEGADYGVGVVAESAKEAKKLAWGNDVFCDTEWTDLRVSWQKNARVDGLNLGVVELSIDALKREIYDSLDMFDCPICEKEGYITLIDGKVMCSDCEDNLPEPSSLTGSEDKK